MLGKDRGFSFGILILHFSLSLGSKLIICWEVPLLKKKSEQIVLEVQMQGNCKTQVISAPCFYQLSEKSHQSPLESPPHSSWESWFLRSQQGLSEPAKAAVGCEDTCNAATCCPEREVPSSCLCLWGPSSSFQEAFPNVLSAKKRECLEHLLRPLTLLLLWLLRAAPTVCGGRSRSLRGSSCHVQALG